MKKGQINFALVWFLVFVVVIAIGLGIFVYVNHTIRVNLGVNIDIGQVNLKNVTEDSFGVWDDAIINGADTMGVMMLLGTVLAMFGAAYLLQGRFHHLMIPIEIIILVIMFIVSVYLSRIYDIYITNVSLLSSTYIDTLPKTSKFVLNLPVITTIVGVIMMIINYIRFKKSQGGDVNVYGY